MPPDFTLEMREECEEWYGIQSETTQGKIDRALERLRCSPFYLPGKVKKLHGRWSGLWQYDVDDSLRIHYTIEGETVRIVYMGPHPD